MERKFIDVAFSLEDEEKILSGIVG